MGGAVLNEVPQGSDPSRYSFAGSTIVMEAASRDEVMAVLRQDVYAKSGVWDVENVSSSSFLSLPHSLIMYYLFYRLGQWSLCSFFFGEWCAYTPLFGFDHVGSDLAASVRVPEAEIAAVSGA